MKPMDIVLVTFVCEREDRDRRDALRWPVRTRIEAEELKYKPRAKAFDDVEPIWID
ncbi:uncharacterized protein SCHCODRAFT_02644514 [Schizophyllum commune H4-8]|uniref:uncharacterized protein n=1 Tax=Schizophyllum commune (strain H4-8 / FGSC 9210) TaxID=578458 RepID=UPI00215F3462|nr:uncharacterized protein SCHCODRAFT_02644514 [Schizophyllum commune H4-8]KAI5885352.1 hypothetical protein SCHCODRAFT_02644514 [Schizophyllum commune H4-8]